MLDEAWFQFYRRCAPVMLKSVNTLKSRLQGHPHARSASHVDARVAAPQWHRVNTCHG